jgi:hypothetical protein
MSLLLLLRRPVTLITLTWTGDSIFDAATDNAVVGIVSGFQPGATLSLVSVSDTPPFSPISLFSSNTGAWYDPSDLSSMWQDSAGTTPAAVDQPVGKLNDKSGNGNHALQATTSKKPTLRNDGTNYYLEFDGADDWLRATFTIANPWDRISAIRQISWTSGDKPLGGGAANAGVLQSTGSSPQLQMNDGALGPSTSAVTVGTNHVVTEGRYASASSRIAVGSGAYTTGPDTGTNAAGGITIAAPNDTETWGENANIRFYGTVMIGRALSDTEIGDTRAFLASKSGVTL